MINLIHIAAGQPSHLFNDLFLSELKKMGTLTIISDGRNLTDAEKTSLLQSADIALTGWDSEPLPAGIVEDPGRLRYVCNITGEMRSFVPIEIIESGILVSNWGDTPAISIAEGTMTLLLAVLKDLHHQIMEIRDDRWGVDGESYGGTLYDSTVGVYGCGAIGRRLISLLKPFGPRTIIYDPYCEEIPRDTERVSSLSDLFSRSQIIVICAGLNDETRGSVTAELLAKLPRHGVLINTARGAIVDQDALFAELETGRLRAGLDVLYPDSLPEGHPARTWQNCILSAHEIHRGWPADDEAPARLSPMHRVCINNVKNFLAGKPIQFEMDLIRYNRST